MSLPRQTTRNGGEGRQTTCFTEAKVLLVLGEYRARVPGCAPLDSCARGARCPLSSRQAEFFFQNCSTECKGKRLASRTTLVQQKREDMCLPVYVSRMRPEGTTTPPSGSRVGTVPHVRYRDRDHRIGAEADPHDPHTRVDVVGGAREGGACAHRLSGPGLFRRPPTTSSAARSPRLPWGGGRRRSTGA